MRYVKKKESVTPIHWVGENELKLSLRKPRGRTDNFEELQDTRPKELTESVNTMSHQKEYR